MPGTRPGMTLEYDATASRRLPLRLDELAVDQALGDLDRIERRTLAQVVGDNPHHEPVLDCRILADAADIGCVLARAFVRRDVAARLALVDDHTTRRAAQDVTRLIGGDRVLELDIDRLG